MEAVLSTNDPDNNTQFQNPISYDELHLDKTENIYPP